MRPFATVLATLGLVAAIGAASIGTARADTLSYSSYSLLNPNAVTLKDSKIGVDVSGYAGQITLNATTGSTLATFCYDIADMLKSSGTFVAGSTLTGTIAGAINALLSHVTPLLSTDRLASSALQIAIWQTEYGSDLSVTADSAILSKAAGYRTNVGNGTWTADGTMAVSFLNGSGTSNQDQIYLSKIATGTNGSASTPVPEPATLALLGIGLAGLLILRRYRQT